MVPLHRTVSVRWRFSCRCEGEQLLMADGLTCTRC
uniref:Uncharacterized protein n=1 Tax=Anopheles minimus TaxID=112268 RepID=A0A182WP21_9DIPT